MGKIQALDQNTINQIAAGEVIDRPASIVKEIMENAIDAGSTRISVEIEDGGVSLIRITDNGSGIESDDIRTAFLRHTTSKIKNALDLMSVSSLGFRGEALSSIAAVCQVEMITKTAGNITGVRYKIEGAKEVCFEEIGAPEGTTFIVRNIFFNTPARRKFLKSPQTEAGYISDIVEKIALSHPEISINFVNNKQTKLHTSGNGELKETIYSVYGREIADNLLEVDFHNDIISMTGYIGKSIISKGNRSFENYFINGRYIKSKIISNAIEDGYKFILMQHKYPFTAINLEISKELLDVNVHPAKMELRFRKGEIIYPFISESIHEALTEKPNIINVELNNTSGKKSEQAAKAGKPEREPEPFETKRAKIGESYKPSSSVKMSNEDNIAEIIALSADKKAGKGKDETENVILLASDKAGNWENADEITAPKDDVVLREDFSGYGIDNENDQNDQKFGVEKNISTEQINKDTAKVEKEPTINDTAGTQQDLSHIYDDFLTHEAREQHKLIGQVFDTYWIVEYKDKMYIIDQHAAHEKVMFEQLMEKLKNKQISSQMINPPIILTLSMNEAALVEKYIDNFKEIGFEIESFGGKDYAVRAVPSDLYTLDSEDVLMDIIDNLSNENSKMVPDIVTEKIASMSCKAAVKGNNKLSFEEANALIEQLLSLENPYNCPHGRPTIISMSKYELEKKFKRII